MNLTKYTQLTPLSRDKKIKPYCFQLSEPVFKTAVFVIVNMPFKKMVAKWKKRFPDFHLDEKLSSAQGLSFEYEKDGLSYPGIWVKHFDWSIHWQGVFVHELNHFIFAQLRGKGLSKSENDEAHCYLFEYYFEECWKKLNERFNKNAKN